MEYVIDDEVKGLLTPLTKEEYSTLETLILDGRHIDPIVVAVIGSVRIVCDGHNRIEICQYHNIKIDVRYKDFESREEMIQWVIDNQFGRRNLTDERKAYYRGKEYLNKKRPEGRPEKNSVTFTEFPSPAAEIAEKHGVSTSTIEKDAKFAEAVDELKPKKKEAVLNGTSGQTKKEVIGGMKPICEKCARAKRVGQEVTKNCPMCKELQGKKPKPKKPDQKQEDNGLPKSVNMALADQWHAECARLLSKMRTECKGAFSWSSWLDASVLDYLKAAEECFITAIPRAVCPDCKGQKVIDKKPCQTCRHGGYMASQVLENAHSV